MLLPWHFRSAWSHRRPTGPSTAATIRIHVEKAGLFSAAGHEHWVSSPIDGGNLDDSEPSAHIAFTVQARKLMVEPDKDLSAENQAEVQRTMTPSALHYLQALAISYKIPMACCALASRKSPASSPARAITDTVVAPALASRSNAAFSVRSLMPPQASRTTYTL